MPVASSLPDAPPAPLRPASVTAALPLATAAQPPRHRSHPPAALVLASLAIGLAFATPLGYLVWRNIDLGSDVASILVSSSTLEPLGRTLVLATTVAGTTVVLGTTLAWLMARTDVMGRRLWAVLVPLPLVIPSYVGAAAMVSALGRSGPLSALPDVRGFVGAVVVLTLLSYPYVYLPVVARLASLPPSPEESARLLGRRPAAVFRTVVLPQASGAIWAGALLVFLYALSEFGAVQIVGYDTLARVIYAKRLDPATSVALSLVLGLLAVAVVGAERAHARRRPVIEAALARRPLTMGLGRWRLVTSTLVATTVGAALVGPLATLAWWAGRGLLNGNDAVAAVASRPGELLPVIGNTALAAVSAAVVAVALVLPVAMLTTRHRSRLGEVPSALVVGGFALPGLVIALAFAFLSLPFALLYQSLAVLIAAYVVHFGAQAMRAGEVAVGNVAKRVDEAARMLGAGRRRRLLTVDLPLMRPGLLAGAGMVLLSTMKELPATLLLAPIGFDTLATRTWFANENGRLAETGLTSLVLVALSGVLTWLLVLRHARPLS